MFFIVFRKNSCWNKWVLFNSNLEKIVVGIEGYLFDSNFEKIVVGIEGYLFDSNFEKIVL